MSNVPRSIFKLNKKSLLYIYNKYVQRLEFKK